MCQRREGEAWVVWVLRQMVERRAAKMHPCGVFIGKIQLHGKAPLSVKEFRLPETRTSIV